MDAEPAPGNKFNRADLPEPRQNSQPRAAAPLHFPDTCAKRLHYLTPEAEPWLYQAARTEFRNLPPSSLRRLLSPDSDCAADSTCEEAEPVSLAPRCTSVMLDETCCVPCAACWTLREISCVAAPCSSTAAAMVEEISDSFSMVEEISLMALTESSVAAW